MKIVSSAWVVPVDAPPIRDGAVAVDRDEVVAVGAEADVLARWGNEAAGNGGAAGVIDLGEVVLLPGLVDAHTHLELSWMRHAPPPRGDFLNWVRAMIARQAPPEEVIANEIARSITMLASSGVVAAGDVGNTTAALRLLRDGPLEGRFFLEVIGWMERGESCFLEAVRALDAPSKHDGSAGTTAPGDARAAERDAAHWPASIVPHGPHSVSPDSLARLAERARRHGDVVSVHLAESREEDQLLRRGAGPGRAFLDEIGFLPAGWKPPRLSPTEVVDRAGLLGPRTLAVHGVHLTRVDARLIAARGATVVLCPRSNAWLGVGEAPVPMLFEEGVRLALGTDSHASNEDLSLFAELRALRALAPRVPADVLVRAATLGGAEALGLSDRLGSITPGKRAALIALPLFATGLNASEPSSPLDEEPYRTILAGPRGHDPLLVPSL